MSGPQYMPFYVGDYLRDTMHLTTEQHGAYLLLLFACWTHGGQVPNNDAELAAITRLPIDEWKRARRKIAKFFKISVKFWAQKRVSVELQRAHHLHDVRSKAGSKGRTKAKHARAYQNQNHKDSDASASPVSSPLRYEETSPRAAHLKFWKKAKELVGDSGLVGRMLREVGRDKVDEALAAVERAKPDEPQSFFAACCQDRVPVNGNDKSGTFTGPKEPLTDEIRDRILAKMREE